MILLVVCFLLGASASLCCYFLTPMADSLWNLLWLILMVPAGFALSFGLYLVCLLFWGFTVNTKKVRDKPSKIALWNLTQGATGACFFCRAHIKVTGLEKLPKNQKVMYVSNHLSKFDQLAMLTAFDGYHTIFVSKPENFNIVVAGPLIAKAGYIPINREDAFEGVKSIRKAADFIKNDQYSVGICPEGTRSKDHEFHEFHHGSFKIAMWGKCPIVIVGIQNSWAIAKRFPWRSTKVYIDILEVIPYEEFADKKTPEISDHCHKVIEEYLEKNKHRDYRFRGKKGSISSNEEVK